MKGGKPDQQRAWFELERFRMRRAFGYGGCVLTLVIAAGALLRLIAFF
jgi:hypothetical protein